MDFLYLLLAAVIMFAGFDLVRFAGWIYKTQKGRFSAGEVLMIFMAGLSIFIYGGFRFFEWALMMREIYGVRFYY